MFYPPIYVKVFSFSSVNHERTNNTESGIALQYSNYLTQIAALIKQNPSITVREIAAELQFADSKSVYYWLEKSKISGLNEFKRLVLSEERPHPSSFSLDVDGIPHYLVVIPLFEWNPQQKSPKGEWYYLHDHPQARGLFAIQVGTNRYSPWFAQNDVLVVSQGGNYPDGAMVLVNAQREYFLGKMINKKIVEPNTLSSYPTTFTPVGIIINQTRYYSS